MNFNIDKNKFDKIMQFLLVSFILLFVLQFHSVSCSGSGGNHDQEHGATGTTTTQSSKITVDPHAQGSHDHGDKNVPATTTVAPKIELITNETAAKLFLEDLNNQATAACQKRAIKDWNYATNITSYNRGQATEASVAFSKFWKEMWGKLNTFNWSNFTDPSVKRQFKLLSVMGISILPEVQLRKYNSAKQAMVITYSTAKVCDYKVKGSCNLTLEPELTEIMMTNRNPDVLKHVWLQWRNQTGRKMRKNYTEMISIFNQAAKLNKFPDGSDYELRYYDTPTFRQDIEKLWNQLKPFYQQLHAYVRSRLRTFYGPKLISTNGPLPAHLLGNMWGQSWINIMDIVKPYNKTSIDITPKMVEKHMTPVDMAKIAEEFFVSLGLSPMPSEFWTGSILEKPKDREIICHASAWDLCNGRDFWIKQCTRIHMEDLVTLHHEMGHTQYQIQYKDLPKTFRDGANPGFHEAIGDLMALSVQTPQHLKDIGLLDNVENDHEADINYLLSIALEKIAFLPFGYLMDLWKWNVYKNITTPDTYNCDWWKLREQYQGVFPPETRTEDDFDPGSKFHITTNSAYIQYFVSTVVQFQFHQALCATAGKFDPMHKEASPLHKCDIYKSHAAGEKLKKMLQLGTSKPWPEALEIVTNQRVLDAGAILDYFNPLIKWLEAENNRTKEPIGWVSDKNKTACLPKKKSGASFNSQSSVTSLLAAVILIVSHYMS